MVMKLLIRALSVSAGLLLSGAGAWAQSGSTANATPLAQGSGGTELYLRDLPENLHPTRTIPLNADNIVMLTQVGSSNVASLTQLGDANQAQMVVLGNHNTTTLAQRGNRNIADISVDGNHNPVDVKQNGNGNEYELDLTGSSNTPVNVLQNGSGNRIQSELSGNGRQYNVSQYGNNNELTQRENASSVLPKGYSVEMRGTGMRITIEQSRVIP